MVALKEKSFRFIEMAKMKDPDIPKKFSDRNMGRVIDQWYWDENERSDVYKVGYLSILSLDIKKRYDIDFYYGFLRSYKNLRQGKSTGAENNPDYDFRALHLVSKVPNARGQWYRDDFSDSDYEDVIWYEDSINLNTLDAAGVLKIVHNLKLKPATGPNMNILSILDRLAK